MYIKAPLNHPTNHIKLIKGSDVHPVYGDVMTLAVRGPIMTHSKSF